MKISRNNEFKITEALQTPHGVGLIKELDSLIQTPWADHHVVIVHTLDIIKDGLSNLLFPHLSLIECLGQHQCYGLGNHNIKAHAE